jgi:ribonuclease D
MIDSEEALRELIDRAMHCEAVALDTEFVWERTYYPILGLVQLGLSATECYLIDVPAIKDLSALGELVSNPTVVKILHDAQQDLTIIGQATGTLPRNIFDSQRAAGFAGLSSTVSLAGLLSETVGIDLPKTETRTNWLQRPLSARQIDYALDDVRYLPEVRRILLERARQKNHGGWLQEEQIRYDNPELYTENDPQEQYRRLKGCGRCNSRELAVLRELTAWRETEARRLNRPRRHILQDDSLLDLARRKPQSDSALSGIRGLGSKNAQVKSEILARIERALALPAEACPPMAKRLIDNDKTLAQVDFILAYIKGKGLDLGIDPALLGTRAEITAFVREGKQCLCSLLTGWRREFIGEELLSLLSGEHSVRLNPATGLPQLN